MSMGGNVVGVCEVVSENTKEYIEFEMDITEAQPGGSCVEGKEETVVRNDVEINFRTDACQRQC